MSRQMVAKEAPPREAAFLRLAGSVRRLFHQLRALAEQAAPGEAGLGASHRAVLESLSLGGAQTVPALARARPVARQHIQVLVNELAELGLVLTRPNPAHKRSLLIELTPAGKRRFESIRAAESALLKRLELPLSARELEAVAERLESLSRALATDALGGE
jgi:DNA-binding MarR family transcriptional regulator